MKAVGCRLFVYTTGQGLHIDYIRMRIHVDVGRAAAYHSATDDDDDDDDGSTALQAACYLKPYSIIAA